MFIKFLALNELMFNILKVHVCSFVNDLSVLFELLFK